MGKQPHALASQVSRNLDPCRGRPFCRESDWWWTRELGWNPIFQRDMSAFRVRRYNVDSPCNSVHKLFDCLLMHSHKLFWTDIKWNLLKPKALAKKSSQNFRNDTRRVSHKIDGGKYKVDDEDGIAQDLRPCGGLIIPLKSDRFVESLNPRSGWLTEVLGRAAVKCLLPCFN